MKKLIFVLVVASMCSMAFGAGPLIPVAGVFNETNPYNPDVTAIHAVNGDGLDIGGPDTHDTAWPTGGHWFSNPVSGFGIDASFEIDLGGLYQIGEGKIWNYNEWPSNGVINVSFFTKENLVDSYTWAGDATDISTAPGDTVTPYGDTFSMHNVTARYILVDVTACMNNTYCGFSELQFYETPEPATIALMGLGALALIRKRRTK